MKTLLRALSGFVLTMLFVPAVLAGQQATIVEEEKFSLIVGVRTWWSTGSSDFNIAGVGGAPNVFSELTWDDVDSTVVELSADGVYRQRYILTADIGFGTVSGGSLRDQDFLGNNRTMLFSDTISAADDDYVLYASVDFGYRILRWGVRDRKPRSSLDLLIGYQHWRERYLATKTVDLFPGTRTIDQGTALTEEFIWDSLRVGARASVEIIPTLSLSGRFLFVPWTHFQLEDIHHLRTDLKKDPSFHATASGGFGMFFDATLSYGVWRGLSAEVGYRWWDITSGEGTITARSLIAGDVREPLNEANSTRHGVTLGVTYRFDVR